VAGGRRFLYYSEVLLQVLPERDYARALEALAEALPLEVAAVNREGLVAVWNARLAARGTSREEALGRPLLSVLPELGTDPNFDWPGALEAALRAGRRTELARHPLCDRVVRATLAPLEPPGGDPLGAVLALDDITDRVRAEERRVVRVRSDAVEALGAGLAHEVRNPLNALSLTLQLLRERLTDPGADREDLVRKADAMVAEMRRLDDLVTHLLEVSRGAPLERQRTRLDPVVDRVVLRLAATAALQGASVAFHPGSSRVLSVDPVRIDRAVHNLVRNAIEAVPRGGHVVVTTRDDPHSTVIVVEDDGPGIAPEDRRRVFELFYTRKRGGTGLGLPLARRAVEDHGGEIELLARPGGGTRCVVHLPADGE
jgi:two-component system sensor histidine kinase AtoS